ncbi:hypothetical protein STFE110948_02490 [Streptobacillus felis]|uniref:hypothetical protein n=1 Tax=Streptobacillus felis TaxID=1384509 RepID=UPI00082FE79B|nr:hypothetical protein [Streptobacillus felis]
MKVNNRIMEYEKRIKEELKRLKNNLTKVFTESLEKYPIHTFFSQRDLQKLIKDIYEKREENPIIVELMYEERKRRKKLENKEIDENDDLEELEKLEKEIKELEEKEAD